MQATIATTFLASTLGAIFAEFYVVSIPQMAHELTSHINTCQLSISSYMLELVSLVFFLVHYQT